MCRLISCAGKLYSALVAILHDLMFYEQVSCDSASAELENRDKYRKYFQLIPTEMELVPAFFGIMQSFGWNRVIIIQEEENLFTLVTAVISRTDIVT